MINSTEVISAFLLVCLISCSSLSQKTGNNDGIMKVLCSSTEDGTFLSFRLHGQSVFEEEIIDSRGCIIDSIVVKKDVQYFICHEYDSYCSLYRYSYEDGQMIKQEIAEITETLLQIDDPSEYSVDYREEKLFELHMREPNKVTVKTNVFPNFSIPNISREIVITID